MLPDFGCCCSQRKCKQLNFACGFSHIEETLKHSLNLCKGLCINDWAAVLKDLLQSPHVEKFLVTCWSWPTAISSLQLCWTRWLLAVLSDLSSCDSLLWAWSLCLQTSDRIIITHISPGRWFPLRRRGRGSVQAPAGTGTLLCFDCRSSCSVNIWWLYFSSVGILPFSGEQTFALPSFQYWAVRERWWLLLHTKGLKGI